MPFTAQRLKASSKKTKTKTKHRSSQKTRHRKAPSAAYKIVLAPPGLGKTTFIRRKPHLDVRDGDDILLRIRDEASKRPICSQACMDYYIRTPGFGFEKWHRANFRALLKAQHQQRLGTILTGFMVGENFREVQRGFKQFIGHGLVQSRKGKDNAEGIPKVSPRKVAVVLPDVKEYIRRGRSRTDRPVHAHYARACLKCYRNLARRHRGKIAVFKRLEDVPFGKRQ